MAEGNKHTEVSQQEKEDDESIKMPPIPPISHGPSFGVDLVGPAQKKIWPEVVGLTSEDAERKIREEMPSAQFQVVPHDSFVTMDFNSRRIRLYVDSTSKISKPPRIG